MLRNPELSPEQQKINAQIELEKLDKEHQRQMRELETRFNLQFQAERNAQEIAIMKQNSAAKKKGE